MKSTPSTIEQLFRGDLRYTVPLFQRKYSWNKEEHWRPLWEDIKFQTESYLENKNKITSHFLGSVIVANEETFEDGHPQAKIIDGQQRLITLQIFLCAVTSVAKKVEVQNVAQQAEELTKNNVFDEQDQENRFKVWPTNADRKQFKEVINDEDSEGTMKSAYDFFRDEIKHLIFQDDGKKDKLLAIITVTKKFLKLVKIELEREDDPQVIFETLNARGAPLLASDLIKNYIFMKIKEEEANRLHKDYWKKFDEEPASKFWNEKTRQGRLTRRRIDLFMFDYLTMKTSEKHSSKPIKVENLYQEFKKWYEDDYKDNPEGFLKDLSKYRNHYIKLIKPEGQTRFDQFARRLKGLDTTTPHPVLLYLMDLLSEGVLLPEQMDQIATYLESWLVRRVFHRDTSAKDYNRFFIDLLNRLKENSQSLEQCVLEELSQTAANTRKWPTDEEFKEAWMNRAVYLQNRSRCAMFLESLNDELHTEKTEKTNLGKSNISIEHLLPQEADLNLYPYHSTSSLKEETESQKDFRERIVHTIGNLTLLTQKLNSSISNGPFDKKIEEIKKYSVLRINNELKIEKIWNEKLIEERGAQLFEVALKIWPRPMGKREKEIDDRISEIVHKNLTKTTSAAPSR